MSCYKREETDLRELVGKTIRFIAQDSYDQIDCVRLITTDECEYMLGRYGTSESESEELTLFKITLDDNIELMSCIELSQSISTRWSIDGIWTVHQYRSGLHVPQDPIPPVSISAVIYVPVHLIDECIASESLNNRVFISFSKSCEFKPEVDASINNAMMVLEYLKYSLFEKYRQKET